MTGLPDAAWWNSVQFTTGEPSGSQGGFAMSREEMMELLRLAENMQELIREQYAVHRELALFDLPASDPASAAFAGDRDHRTGARGAGDSYLEYLRDQEQYLRQLVTKLSGALSHVETVDDDRAQAMNLHRPNI